MQPPPDVGSWFGQFGDNIINAGKPDNVIYCIASEPGQPASSFGLNGKYHSVITTACLRLIAAGLTPTFIGVGQGETETFYGSPASEWTSSWLAAIDVVRNIGIASPWYFAEETWNIGVTSPTIEAAQAAILTARPGLFAGPNIDVFVSSYRYDNTHFNAAGCAAVASAWAAIAPPCEGGLRWQASRPALPAPPQGGFFISGVLPHASNRSLHGRARLGRFACFG